MAETSPSSTEKAVVVTNSHLCRLWTLTIASLTLNALILVLLVAGAIIHHHQQKYQGFAGRGGRDGGCFYGHGQFDGGRYFHRFGGRGWGSQGSFGGGGFGEQGGGRFSGGYGGGPRFGGGFGPGPGGPGMPGMGGMNVTTGGPVMIIRGKPDPAMMSEGILNHLSTALSLTDDEKAKIKPIIEQQVAEIQKQMDAQRQAMQKQIEDAKAKIKPLLTADQQKQLDAMPLPGQPPDQKTGP